MYNDVNLVAEWKWRNNQWTLVLKKLTFFEKILLRLCCIAIQPHHRFTLTSYINHSYILSLLSLRTIIIHYFCFSALRTIERIAEMKRLLLDELPDDNYQVLKYIIQFLQHVSIAASFGKGMITVSFKYVGIL